MVVKALLETIKIWVTGLLRGSAFYLLFVAVDPHKPITDLQVLLLVLAGVFWEYANEK